MEQSKPRKVQAGPGRGVNKWVPTPKQRKTAELLFACGATKEQVALQLGVSGDRVKRHLRKEYEFGFELANLTLYGALWEKAVVKGDTACLIFLAKNRLGMMDRPALFPQHPNDIHPTAHEELCVKVTYRYSTDPQALPPPPRDRLPPPTIEAEAKAA